jgi:hypothetical protein
MPVGARDLSLLLFLGVKEPELKTNHSPPSDTEIKNECSCAATLPICLHGLGRDNLTFYLTPSLTAAKILQ